LAKKGVVKATGAPENASDKSVTHKSSDEHVAMVDKPGNITSVAVGTANIIGYAVAVKLVSASG